MSFNPDQPRDEQGRWAGGDPQLNSPAHVLGEQLRVDNPAREGSVQSLQWLKEHPLAVTARFQKPVMVNPKTLIKLPGSKGEHKNIDEARVSELTLSMTRSGFHAGNEPLIAVEANGHAQILEGNHRVRAAHDAGLSRIPIEVRYYGGSEQLAHAWRPEIKP